MLVDAHGHIHRFRAVLVAHKDAVLSGICHVDVVDGDGAALGLLSDDELVLVSDLLVVAEPRDLRGRFAVDEARQAQRLAFHDGDHIRKALSHFGPIFLGNGRLLQPLVLQQGIGKRLSRQVQMPLVCLLAVEHLQRVFAFIILCWVTDFNPDFLHIAARLCPGLRANLLLLEEPAGLQVADVVFEGAVEPETLSGALNLQRAGRQCALFTQLLEKLVILSLS